jgi:hypothetical protein
MCILKYLSYCYNNFRYKQEKKYEKKDDEKINENYYQPKFNFYKQIDNKEDKWIKFPKKEGCCTICYKFSGLLSIIDINSKDAICYRCYSEN